MMNHKKLSRREFLTMSAGLAVGSWLTACVAAPPAVQQQAAEAEKSEAEAAPAAEAVTVSFSGWGGTEEDEGVRSAMKVFEEQNSGVKMEWVHIPETYNDKLLAMVAAGTPPDTGFVGSDIFTTFARDGMLLDITDLLKADPIIGKEGYFIEPQETQRCTYEGKWYGIGSCWVAPHIYYNADIFEQEGIDPPAITRKKPGIGINCYRPPRS
jgi:multiple sugar transport system substrate-binding protein